MKNQKFDVIGMSCAVCVSHVEKSVKTLDGVRDVRVSLLTNSMQVIYDEQRLSEEAIIEAVNAQGYRCSLPKSDETVSDGGERLSDEEKALRRRFIISAVLMVVLMYFSMSHMIPYPVPHFFHDADYAAALAAVQLLLTVPIVWLNRKYFAVGIPMLIRRSPNMDTLVAIGSGAAFVYGVFALGMMVYGQITARMDIVASYSMSLYFESAGMILTLVTLGKYLEGRSRKKTGQALSRLIALAPRTAFVIRDGVELEIESSEIIVGDIVAIRPGQTLGCDGEIVSGSAVIDESSLTGESIPAEKSVGDKVSAGTVNVTGAFTFRAEKVGSDTVLSQMIRLVEEAASSKAPIARLADKVAAVFVPIVMTIAVIATAVWLIAGEGFEFALTTGISVLVISCPCALGLATPLAIMVGVGRGAENGILIRSAAALEAAHSIDTVVMDKTGTLTEGVLSVCDIIAVSVSEEELLEAAAMAESVSEHPIALAIIKKAAERGIEPIGYDERARLGAKSEIIPGKGIVYREGGNTVACGNMALMSEFCGDAASLADKAAELSGEGKTVVLVCRNSSVIGAIAASDTVRDSSARAVAELKKRGIRAVMLTGDREETARAVSAKLGIDEVIASVLPDGKAAAIKKLINEEGRHVAMVGDGINDAPALAAAHVGMAVGAGTDIAIESADIVLMRNTLEDAVSAITLSRSVMANIKENLFWAFFYNCIGIPLAAGVLWPAFGIRLSPMIGAAAMSLSSIFVVMNALRLRFARIKSENIQGEDKMEKVKKDMLIEGMMCMHCSARVEAALSGIPGTKATIDLEAKTAHIECDGSVTDQALTTAVTTAGYTVVSIKTV